MANIPFRMRRANSQGTFDVLWPETTADNVLYGNDKLETTLTTLVNHTLDKTNHLNRGTSTGSAGALILVMSGVTLFDGLPVLVKLHLPIADNATLNFNSTGARNIVTISGQNITSGPRSGSYLFLVWDGTNNVWVAVNYNNPTKMVNIVTTIAGTVSTFTVEGFNRSTDSLMSLNFGQTVLRETLDYTLSGTNTVTLLNSFTIKDGEKVVSTILKNTV